MSLIKTMRGVLISKNLKNWDDGSSGYFCTILLKDESTLNFWAPSAMGKNLSEAKDVEGFDDEEAENFRVECKDWNGKRKYQLQEPIVM